MTDVTRYVPPPSHDELTLLQREAELVVSTEAVPKKYRGNLPGIIAAGLRGREYGVSLMVALSYIDVIEGKPELNAAGCCGLVRAAGHSISGGINEDGQSAIAKGRRRDTGDEMSVRWTIDMAKRAGLTSKQVWKQYPEDMLWARAVDSLCRRLFPDVVMGLTGPVLDGDGFVEHPPAQNGTRATPARMVDPETGEITEPVDIVTIPAGSDSEIDDAELVNTVFDVDAYRARANALSGEWRKQLRDGLAKHHLGNRQVDSFAPDEYDLALKVLEEVEAEAEATMARRRKHAHAICADAGLGDDERHALIAYATDGAATSANVLSEDQLTLVVQCCESLTDGSLVLAFTPEGTPIFRTATPTTDTDQPDESEPPWDDSDPERPFVDVETGEII